MPRQEHRNPSGTARAAQGPDRAPRSPARPAFAVLGLRALSVLLAGAVDRFRYLRQGIALLLVFIGGKMLFSPVVELPVTVSLGAIVVVAVRG
jgi:hypothetical protein